MYDAECEDIESFIAAYKALDGLMPEWTDFYSRDAQVRWGIVDENDIQHAELCVTCDRPSSHITFVVMHRQRLIYRLDIVPEEEEHPNPWGAHRLGLPATVAGPHVHGWAENKEYVRLNGFGQLPYRRRIGGLTQTIADGLAWVAQDLGMTVRPEQRVCEPPQRGLFD
jgi:hypothetical protein